VRIVFAQHIIVYCAEALSISKMNYTVRMSFFSPLDYDI